MSPQPIANQAPLTAVAATTALTQLLGQVAELHRQGRFHGCISPATVTWDSTRAGLKDGPTSCRFGNESNDSLAPPELQGCAPITLPTEIAAARGQLAAKGLDVDPRRIDVYQLGALLLWMVSGTDVPKYLRSAKARGDTPQSLRGVIDGALGLAASERCQSCDELGKLLDEALQDRSESIKPTAAYEVLPAREPARGVLDQLDRLGAYQIVERIGAGGMGDVYRAYEEALDRHVAIKVLPPELARHPDFVRRFRAEATAVAKLGHPSIVQIHAIGEDSGHHFFVMPFIRGESLAVLMARQGRLSVDVTLAIIEQLLGGLDAAHKRGLIHRDIKPANILLDHDSRRALLADFGLVKTIADVSSHTASGVVMGTVDYISPEQARGKEVDGRADLYSVGVLMYQMLAGRLPFEAETPTAMMFKHAYDRPPPLAEAAPDIPPRLAAVVTRLLAKDPGRRHQTAREVLVEIAALQVRRAPSTYQRERADEPQNAEAPALPRDVSPSGWPWWNRIAAFCASLLPPSVARLLDTQLQVDGAIAEYEQRCRKLGELVHEAEEVVREFAAQAADHHQAAAAANQRSQSASDPVIAAEAQRESAQAAQAASEFDRQLTGQRTQLGDLKAQFAKAEETLAQLRSQRDALLARLHVAQGRMALERAQPSRRYRHWLVGGVTTCVILALITAALMFFFRAPQPPPLRTLPSNVGSRPIPLQAPFSAEVAQQSQEAWGRYLGLAGSSEMNSLGMSFVVVPPGEFVMGTPSSEVGHWNAEGPQHAVRLTKAILVGTHEVTQQQFSQVMSFNPSYFSPTGIERRKYPKLDTRVFPVENVSWYDACLFCNSLSRADGLPPYYAIAVRERKGKNVVRADVKIQGGMGYRLPTEAEFEYFARAGTTTPFWFGSVHDGTQGNVMGTRPYGTTHPGPFLSRTTTVGSYPPNPFGIFDTDGNVGEWGWDVLDPNYYSRFRKEPAVDPTGPVTGERRTVRSNSSQYEPMYSRAGRRHGDVPFFVSGWTGIRVVRFAE